MYWQCKPFYYTAVVLSRRSVLEVLQNKCSIRVPLYFIEMAHWSVVIQWENSAALPLRCWGGKCGRGGHCLSTWVHTKRGIKSESMERGGILLTSRLAYAPLLDWTAMARFVSKISLKVAVIFHQTTRVVSPFQHLELDQVWIWPILSHCLNYR